MIAATARIAVITDEKSTAAVKVVTSTGKACAAVAMKPETVAKPARTTRLIDLNIFITPFKKPPHAGVTTKELYP